MTDGRGRLEKVLALAINPGAVEGEAIAALLRARELVKQNPALAHPPSPAPISSSKPDHPESSFRVRITGVHPDWLLILVSLLSKTGYEVGVKYQIDFDFSETFVAVTSRSRPRALPPPDAALGPGPFWEGIAHSASRDSVRA
jgi:hypothetical protein